MEMKFYKDMTDKEKEEYIKSVISHVEKNGIAIGFMQSEESRHLDLHDKRYSGGIPATLSFG